MNHPEMKSWYPQTGLLGVSPLSPVHQHEVILQKWTLGVGPHHAHQAACMQLLVLMEGMCQLVHSLTVEEENKYQAKKYQLGDLLCHRLQHSSLGRLTYWLAPFL